MQITRETIKIKTPFVFTADSCDCCDNKFGYDEFHIELPLRAVTELPKKYKWQPETHKIKTKPLLDKLDYLMKEDMSEWDEKEVDINKGEVTGLLGELSALGVTVIPCWYELKVVYEVDAADSAHCIITYIEDVYGDKCIARLFQANLGSVEELEMIFGLVSRGLDVESLDFEVQMKDEDMEDYDDEDDVHGFGN